MIGTLPDGTIRPISGQGTSPLGDLDSWIFIPGARPTGQFTGGPGGGAWPIFALPDIDEDKDAQFADAEVLGRSSPIPSYKSSGYKQLNVTFHLHSTSKLMAEYNVRFIRAMRSFVYPQYENTYLPPYVGKFKCGPLWRGRGGGGMNFLLSNYSFGASSENVWPDLIPVTIAFRCSMKIVYPYSQLPGAADVVMGDD